MRTFSTEEDLEYPFEPDNTNEIFFVVLRFNSEEEKTCRMTALTSMKEVLSKHFKEVIVLILLAAHISLNLGLRYSAYDVIETPEEKLNILFIASTSICSIICSIIVAYLVWKTRLAMRSP